MSKINDLEEEDLGPISLEEEDLEAIIVPEVEISKQKEKKKKIEEAPVDLEDDDPNNLPIVLERCKAGLVGTLFIRDNINKPMIKKDDFVHLRQSSRIEKGDFVLYSSHDEYFLRRVIKFEELNIYVAGDNEDVYHVIRKEDIVAKAIGRQREKKHLSFVLDKKNKLYRFKKINLAGMRIKKVNNYDDDQNQIALQNAIENLSNIEAERVNLEQNDGFEFDMDAELKSFINPDYLAREVELNKRIDIATVVDAVYNEKESIFRLNKVSQNSDVQYVDENGNPVEVDEDGNPIYLDENGNRIQVIIDDGSAENEESKETLEESNDTDNDENNSETELETADENSESVENTSEDNTNTEDENSQTNNEKTTDENATEDITPSNETKESENSSDEELKNE